jgi:hypothetical protein
MGFALLEKKEKLPRMVYWRKVNAPYGPKDN